MIAMFLACSISDNSGPQQEQQWVYGLCNQNEYDYTADNISKVCEESICKVPAGEFILGSCSETLDVYPQKIVYLDEFWIDQTEVSVRNWDLCVSSGNCVPIQLDCQLFLDNYESDIPIVCVDYEQATNYCSYAGGRLPTEFEWEKSARGVDGRLFPWGDSNPNCDMSNNMNYENTNGNITQCNPYTLSVSEPLSDESPFGVYNMAGNVMEWTSTNYDFRLYQRSSNNKGGCYYFQEDMPGGCEHKSLRGGAYNQNLRTRSMLARSFGAPDLKDRNLGFRCVYDTNPRK